MKNLWLWSVALLLGLGVAGWSQDEHKDHDHGAKKQEPKKDDTEKKVDDTKVQWVKSLKEGMKKAKEENKPLMVDYHTFLKNKKTGKYLCKRCEDMDKETYQDRELIKKINESFIPVLVELEKLSADEKTLRAKFKEPKECLLLFLNSEGKTLVDSDSKPLASLTAAKRDDVQKMIDEALKGKTAGK